MRTITLIYDGTFNTYRWLKAMMWARNEFHDLGYKIKYKWTWNRVKDLLKTLLITLIILVILWFFPPTHKIIMEFYESNTVIQVIVDIILGIFKGIWNGIRSIFVK